MQFVNWPIVLATSLIPLILGMIWYNPKVLGNAWMRAGGIDTANPPQINMIKAAIQSVLLGLLFAIFMVPATLHATHVFSMFDGNPLIADPNSDLNKSILALITQAGDRYLTFKHGMVHGFISALMGILPAIGMTALFEGRSWRYSLIVFGFWAICAMIMGGIICGFAFKIA
jgi:Protein of unknown function (DUF1761)